MSTTNRETLATLCDRGPSLPDGSKIPWHRRGERMMNGYDQPVLVGGFRFDEQRAIVFRVNNWDALCDALDSLRAQVDAMRDASER